jgi:drug/metabolite transporter (DMT)-like permease
MQSFSRALAWPVFIFLSLVWGSSFILIKRGLDAFTPIQIGALRMLIAALILLPWTLRGLKTLTQGKKWGWLALVAIFGNGLPALLFPLAETRISSASAGMLNALSPLFVLILGRMFFSLHVTPRQVGGVVLGLAGAIVLILAGPEELDLFDKLSYSLLAMLATLGYGISSNVMKTHFDDVPALLASGGALLLAATPYAGYVLLDHGVWATFVSKPAEAWTSLGYILILGGIGSALALVLFYRLVQLTDAVFSASVTYAIPVVALFWGAAAGEPINLYQGLSLGFILAGVYLSRK